MEIPTPLLPDYAPTPTAPVSDAKLKNILALAILLGGLFVGSLFVDVAQLITKNGFSGAAMREQTVLETGGKTWVAFTDPAITVQVVNDEQCTECNVDEALLWMRRIVPTLNAQRIAYDSTLGQSLILRHDLKSLPAFIFDGAVKTTDFYAQATPIFHETGGEYFFDMNKIGLPVGKYLAAPKTDPSDIELGNLESKVRVTVFTDFACDYCKTYAATYKKLIADYGDRVAFVVKHFPLPNHPQAETAALAASCANAEGQYQAYADLLFAHQADWANRTNSLQTLKKYAWQVKGMKGGDFVKCLDAKTYAATLEADKKEAENLNLQAAPATFVGTEFLSGAAPYEDIQKLIDTELAKAN